MPAKCRPPLDDYVECLHHTNEACRPSLPCSLHTHHSTTHLPVMPTQIARAKAIKTEFIRKAEHQATEGRKAADIIADGAIVGVGLIKREGEAK